MPFLTDYTKRKKITIDNTNVDSNLTDFPLLVKFTDDADIGADIDSNGLNIRFTSSDGTTLLKYERQSFDNTGSTATGIFWVKVPTVNGSVDTDIYIYYKSDSPADGEDAVNVWDSNYVAVWHFEQDPTITAPQILDSTANNHDLTSHGSMTSGDLVAAQIGNGLDFDGTDDYLDGSALSALNGSTDITVEFIGKPRTITTFGRIVHSNDVNPFGMLTNGNETDVTWDIGGSQLIVTGVLSTSEFRYIAGTYSASTASNIHKLYQNGTQVGSQGAFGALGTNNTLQIGDRADGTRNYNGILDEIRISSSARSADWIKFTYYNFFQADNELTFSSQETVGGGHGILLSRMRNRLCI